MCKIQKYVRKRMCMYTFNRRKVVSIKHYYLQVFNVLKPSLNKNKETFLKPTN